MKVKIENLDMFFRYACPCLENRLGEEGKKIIESYIKRKEIPENLERLFPNALECISKITKRLNKKKVDEEVIKEYFFGPHNKSLEKLYKSEKLLSTEVKEKARLCMVLEGVVREKRAKDYVVNLGLDEKRECRSLIGDLEEGERVYVHWYYIIDRA